MAIPFSLIGGFSAAYGPVIRYVIERVAPVVWEYASDPKLVSQSLSRFGDLVVWNGEGGRQVIAGIETLTENQQRIEVAVNGIEQTQLAMAGTLGTVQALSMATFGITSLSAGFMAWRMAALHKRLVDLGRRIDDIETRLDARDRALLDNSLSFLKEFERKKRESDLKQALVKAREAAATYGLLVERELEEKKRLAVLNYHGRCYLLSLMTELHCMVLRDDRVEAIELIGKEKPRLTKLVDTTYRETLAKAPEIYLDPNLSSDGVSLDLMTDLYQQLQQAGVLKDVEIRDACDLFEHLRGPIYQKRTKFWRPFRRSKDECLKKLKYLIACVEDCNRVESMGLLIENSIQEEYTFAELRERIGTWRREIIDSNDDTDQTGYLAYQFI